MIKKNIRQFDKLQIVFDYLFDIRKNVSNKLVYEVITNILVDITNRQSLILGNENDTKTNE